MEKHFSGTRKRQNRKEKETEMKDEKNEKIWKLFENLNTENCLK